MKTAFLIFILIHGLIHLLGFVKAFQLANASQLNQPITKPAGMLWLLATILFLVSFLFLLLNNHSWWVVALAAVILSQVMIFHSWTDAKFGSIANVIVLIPIVVAFANSLPSSYQSRYRTEVEKKLKLASDAQILTEKDLQPLPAPVQKYLRYAGAVGRPKVYNFRASFHGSMKRERRGGWMKIAVHQYDFFLTKDAAGFGGDDRARLFYIESSLFGVPFDGLHAYVGSSATMQIKVASLFQVADAKGEKMNHSETVTLFNDMCLLAPATLIDRSIQWETVDSQTVKAKFTNQGNTITALLYFNEDGGLTNFVSNDRFLSADGKTYLSYPWSTPIRGYIDFNGRKVAGYADATWHMSEGKYCYAKFDLTEIDYNCTQFK